VEQFILFLQKAPFHLILFGVVVISGGMLLFPLFTRSMRGGTEVDPMGAVQLINRKDAVVIDIRSDKEYSLGHITGARNIPEANLESRMKEIEKLKSMSVIVACASGRRSATAAGVLRKSGFTEASTLRGGIAAWQQAGMPLEK
jgi:rhodanese-related sulfurtransferase